MLISLAFLILFMQEVFLNLFPIEVKAKRLLVYDILQTEPATLNRTMRFRLAANIAKHLSKTQPPVFSVGDKIYSPHEIPTQHQVDLDIEGTTISFNVTIKQSEEIDLARFPRGPERLTNKLVDWYCQEKIPNSFHKENVNYVGENIFAKLESRLYKRFKININEGIMRATRTFAGRLYLLLDVDYRRTWERSLWDSVKFFVKTKLNKDIYLPDQRTIQAINEKYGRAGGKRGVRVQGKNRIGEYEVIEFDYTKTPETPSTAAEGMSQEEYFSKVYGSSFTIKDKKQPLVKVRVLRGYFFGEEMYHVPELLEFDRIPPQFRENKKLMSALANIEKPMPRGRFAYILNFIQGDPFGRTKGFADDEFVNQFLKVSREPVMVNAHVLPKIKIRMGKDVFFVSSDSEFLSNIFKRKFHRVPKPRKIVLLYDKEREDDVLRFYSMLREATEERGMDLPDPSLVPAAKKEFDEYKKALSRSAGTDLVITFSPHENDKLYRTIKEELLIKYGVLSQNITYENTLDIIDEYESKGNELGIKTILTLIAMQLCAKLGGAPWAFNEPIYSENVPVLGLDIFHGKEKEDTVTGACAVFDPYGEYLFSDVSMDKAIEKVTSLKNLLTNVLNRYIKQLGEPDGLLILRDGLNYTQEQKFLYGSSGELAIIEGALSELGISNYILVMEKKGTRLRMFKKLSQIKVDNPDPGTVIIGAPFEPNEMLMVSQETYQGTVEPVMYKVIKPLNPDMEKIALAIYKLSRHHWNTHRAIKIPAPALHADMITYLVRRILKRSPTKKSILDKPFYL